MMYVWMRKCRRQASCRHCPKPILNGEYMVICRYYKRTRREDGGNNQNWSFTIHFHPQCWIDQAIAALEEKPIVETRGKKKLSMTDDMREARFAVLRRRGSVLQRIRREIEKSAEEQNTDRIIHLGGLLNQLKEEIEPLGGVPESWN